MTVTYGSSILRCCVVILCIAFLAACAGNNQPAVEPPAALQGRQEGFQLPGLAELERAPSIRVNQQENLIQAIDYDPGLGSRNLSPDHVDSRLTLIP